MKYIFVTALLLANLSHSFSQILKEELRSKTEKELAAIVEASSAVVGLAALDLTTGETFTINEQKLFPQASAIKIPILMEVFKQAHQRKLSLTDKKEVTRAVQVGGSGILQQFQDPVTVSLRDLCTLMISHSDNTATNVIIRTVGMERVNQTLQELGCTHTKLQRYMIDTVAAAQGRENLSTPADAVKILQLLYQGNFINREVSDQVIGVMKKNPRKNSRIAAALPAHVPIAFKPGGLVGVSTEWAIVYLHKKPYAIAVMETGRVPGDAGNTMEKLSQTVFNYFIRLGGTPYGSY
jgi:Beta-lactamase class A